MTEIARSDLFFLVTTFSVVILTILLIVILFYAVNILRDIKRISRLANEEARNIKQDIDDARKEIKQNARQVKGFVQAVVTNTGLRFGFDLLKRFLQTGSVKKTKKEGEGGMEMSEEEIEKRERKFAEKRSKEKTKK